jgi:hypothetical protein
VLWQAWETVAKTTVPVILMFATDDEDIPLTDMLRLKALLSLRSSARTEFFSGTHRWACMFSLVGQLLGRSDNVSKVKPTHAGGAEGF